MYFVNGKNVTTNGSMNMSKDELKAMIIEKVEKLVPDQAELIKQNIDQVMATGMIKFESKETATYELQDDGWVKSIKSESTNEAMGQQTKTTATVTIK
jgi:polyphosphate kinase